MATHRLDDALADAVVVHGPANLREAARQRRFAHERARPEALQEFILAHYPVTMRQKIGQDLEDLGLDCYRLTSAPQFTPRYIKLAGPKGVEHGAYYIMSADNL